MTTRRLIGYATTNSNGVATLNYIGQGLGEVDIVAETGGEMLFHHSGTDTNETNPFYYNSSNIQVSTDSTGTLLTNSASTTYNYYANIGATSEIYDFQAPFTIEFDVVSYSATYCGIQNTETGQTGALRNFSQLTNKTSFHIKVIVDGSKIIYQIDNDTPIEQTYSTSKVRVSLTLNNGTLKYKNFFIYKGSTQLTSDPIPLLDCTVYDDMETTQYETKYKRDNTANITYSTDWAVSGTKSLKWDLPSAPSGNASYWGLVFIASPTSTAFDIEWVKGKTLQFEIDTKTIGTSSNAFTIVAYLKTTTNTNWSKIGEYAVPSGEAHNKTVVATGQTLTYEIPSNATQFWLRFGSLGTVSKTLYVDNWKLYPI